MTISFGEDPIRAEVRRILTALQDGADPGAEQLHVDFKEEAGRRKHGKLLSRGPENETAAQQLAGESACMANTPGGGALIVGVADDGALVGAELDPEWLRFRIYQITDKRLTVEVHEETIRGIRLLIVTAQEAAEPVRYKGRIRWRVNDTCVEIDATSWQARERQVRQFDWSAQGSAVDVDAVRESAVEQARDFLRASNETAAQELAGERTAQLLRRLNAVTGDGLLTNAGVLLFVGRGEPVIDYMYREFAGGDSSDRVVRPGRALVEELADVFQAARSHNALRHLSSGLATGQVRALPERALREAIVNGVAHRSWHLADPTVVEHIGRSLRVTSPGGFYGGVNERNIITHPSKSRNTALTELLAALKVAEREGIGVDRMVGDMLRLGHDRPEIRETEGPAVVANLIASTLDEGWIAWLGRFDDHRASEDLRMLMMVREVIRIGWLDQSSLVPVLQLSPAETRAALNELTAQTVGGRPLLIDVDGTPPGSDPAYALNPEARHLLESEDVERRLVRVWPSRNDLARTYAAARGRISTTELGSLAGAHATNVGSVLKRLEQEGILRPSRSNRRGPGFYYVYVMAD